MNEADKRNSENVVFDEHRLAQVGAAFYENCRDEVRQERVREPDAGVCGIFRWEVVSEGENRDHAEVKRKIAEIVEQPWAQAGVVFDDCATEHFPKNQRHDRVKNEITNGTRVE